MMGTVINLDGMTKLDVPVERVLNAALEAELDSVMVIGERDGELYLASDTGKIGLLLIALERAKARLMQRYTQ